MRGLAFNKASTLLAAVDDGGNTSTLVLWDTDSRQAVARRSAADISGLATRALSRAGGGRAGALQARPGRKDFGVLYGSCAFSESGKTLFTSLAVASPCAPVSAAAAGGHDPTVNDGYLVAHNVARNLEQTRCVRVLRRGIITCLDRNGRYLAAGTSTGQVLLIEAETLQIVRETSAHTMSVTDVRALGGGDVLSCGYDNVCALSLFGRDASAALRVSTLGIKVDLNVELSDSGLGRAVKRVADLTRAPAMRRCSQLLQAAVACVDIVVDMASERGRGMPRAAWEQASRLLAMQREEPLAWLKRILGVSSGGAERRGVQADEAGSDVSADSGDVEEDSGGQNSDDVDGEESGEESAVSSGATRMRREDAEETLL